MAKKADPEQPGTPGPATPGSGAAGPSTTDAGQAVGAHPDVAAMSYERARDELVDIVARLENGSAGLEESMGLWQRGEALAAHCATWLDRAEARISAGE